MADRRIKKVSSRYGTNNTNKPKRGAKKKSSHWFRNLFLLSLIGVGFVLFSYMKYLDFNLREKFEGKRWAIPARVYASPVEL
jgi:penicillin-binding protein 1B